MKDFALAVSVLVFVGAGSFPKPPFGRQTPPDGTLPSQTGESDGKRPSARFGYIDRRGAVIIQPRFEGAGTFVEGLAPVRSAGRWGFIDKAGSWVIQPQFTQAESFSEGFAPVNVAGLWGFVNNQGSVVVAPTYERVGRFSSERALAMVDHRWRYLDRSGKAAFDQTFSQARDFSEGLAAVCSDQVSEATVRTPRYLLERACAWGFIDPSGRFVIEPRFEDARDFSEGLAAVRIGWKWGIVDRTGRVIIEPRFDDVGRYSDGLAQATGGGISGAWLWQEGKIFVTDGYIDRTGRWAFSSRTRYYYPSAFSEGLAQVEDGSWPRKLGYVDKTGKIVVKRQYTSAEDFSEGLAAGRTPEGCGYIDHTGSIVLRVASGCGGRFSEGMAVFAMQGIMVREAIDQAAEKRWLEKAQQLLKQGRYLDADSAFMEASSYHQGKCPACILGQAEAWAGLGYYGQALQHCDDFLRTGSSDQSLLARGHGVRGEALAEEARAGERTKLAEAEEELRLALKMDSNLSSAHYDLGLALLKDGNEAEGLQELRSYVDREPGGAWVEDAGRFLASPELARQDYAPSFTVSTLERGHLSLAELRGKVVLLDFWASWCPPCQQTLPQTAKLAHEFPPDQFVLISISSDQDEQVLREFIRAHPMDWPQSFDPKDTIGRKFHISGLPSLVLIDQQGVVRFRGTGWQPRAVESKIRHLVSQ